MELNSTPAAIDAGIEASTNAVTDGRFFVRGVLQLDMVVAALQRAARILLATFIARPGENTLLEPCWELHI